MLCNFVENQACNYKSYYIIAVVRYVITFCSSCGGNLRPIVIAQMKYFIVTLDYKALLLIKKNKKSKEQDPSASKSKRSVLGGRGLSVEFCVFCTAIRVSIITVISWEASINEASVA